MVTLPPEMIYKIASFLKSHRDIYALADVFPNLRFKLVSAVDYEIYETSLKDKFIVEKVIYTGDQLIAFPAHLKLLQFHRYFNQPITLPLPEKLETIYFGSDFNQPVDGLLPKNLQRLICFGNFNQPLDNLPSKLQELNLGEQFNHPLNHLPKNLKKLWIRHSFKHSLDQLPDSIETLHIMCHYNRKINKLSNNIKILRTWTTFPEDYSGERELDYLKEFYPHLTINYSLGFGNYIRWNVF
jgi:hypothetical protein